MKYKDIRINEAVIKVPVELINKTNMYVSSCVFYVINQRMKSILADNGDITQYKKALQFLQNSGAKNINENTYNSIINNNIKLDIDYKKFFAELNYKGITPDIIRKVKSYDLSLLVTDKSSGENGSVNKVGDGLSILVSISRALNSNLDPLQASQMIMETVYHESQHMVQYLAIEPINKNSKQLQMHDTEKRSGDMEYYQSGIEFGPQLGNLVGAVKATLEKMSDTGSLTGKIQTDMTKALQLAMEEPEYGGSRKFLIAIYNKDQNTYKKVMKEIYKKSSEFYEELSAREPKGEFEQGEEEDLEAIQHVPETVINNISQNKGYSIKRYGKSGNSHIEVSYEGETWSMNIDFIDLYKDEVRVKLKYKSSVEVSILSPKEAVDFSKYLQSVNAPEADDINSALEIYSGSSRNDIDSSVILSMINLAKNMAKGYNVPFEILADNKFNINGHEFEITPVGSNNVIITNDDMAIDFKLKSSSFSSMMFALTALIKAGKEDEALWALASNTSSMDIMDALNQLLQELK